MIIRTPALILAFVACAGLRVFAAPTHLEEERPVSISSVAPAVVLVDFGRVAFGNLELRPPAGSQGALTVRFGEALRGGRIDPQPPGSVRTSVVTVPLGASPLVVAPPADLRNTKPPAVLTPAAWGTLTPFRWVEIEGWPGTPGPDQIRRRAAYAATWDDTAAGFESSDPMLNQIWELSRYSIKATTFAGVFVDGDRERLAYEADAYLNQLGYYATSTDPQMPRDTFERLLQHPTWPTEWAPHMVFISYADWMQTADRDWLAKHFEALKGKLLDERVGPDGLIVSTPEQIKRGDIVDWPVAERDGFVFTPINTVVNAFHLRALVLMSRLAQALGRKAEAQDFAAREHAAEHAFVAKLLMPDRHLFRDGAGTDHASLHANLFPLAFGLAPAPDRRPIADWLGERGMRCSVYAAQYLLEGLFENGAAETALHLMTAPGDRSWRHMVESGTTITWEAWDQTYKPNQDWNHAWGAAPANLLPRFVVGVQPLAPGWQRALVQPHPAALAWCRGRVPTMRGAINAEWRATPNFQLTLTLPAAMPAHVVLPARADDKGVWRDGRRVAAHRDGTWWVVDADVSGHAVLEVR